MAAPTYNNAGVFYSASFDTTVTGSFDCGTGTNVGLIAIGISNNNTQSLSSLVVGGQTLTAETEVAMAPLGFAGNMRAFRLAASSLTGSQSFTLTANNSNGRLDLILYAAKDCTAITHVAATASTGYTLTQTISSDTNSLVAALWAVVMGGTIAADSPTVERAETACWQGTGYALEEAGSASVTVSATVTGGSTPARVGPIFSLTGTAASAPVLTTPTGSATGKDAGTAGATTDTGSGTMYALARIGGSAASAATIVSTGTSLAISSTGAKTIPLSSLTPGSAYTVDICHAAAGGNSNVVSCSPFTPTTLALTGSLSAQSGVTGAALSWAGANPSALVTGAGIGSKTWTISSAGGTGLTTINSSTGVVSGTLPAAGSYTVGLTVTDQSTAGSEAPQTEVITFGLTVSASGAATSVTLSGPSGGVVSVPSTTFAVGANGTITGTVIVTPSDSGGGGSFSPTSVSISAGTPTATFTYTPGALGVKSISVTNNGGLANPSPISYTVTSGSGTYSLQIGPGYLMAGTNKIISTLGQWSAWQSGDIGGLATPTLNGSSTCDTNGRWLISGLPSPGTTRVLIKTTSGEFVGYWVGTAA